MRRELFSYASVSSVLQREEQAADEDGGGDAGAEVEPDVHLRADEACRRQDAVAPDDRLRLRPHRLRRVRRRGTYAGLLACSGIGAATLNWYSAPDRTRFGEQGFYYRGPATWNTLPSDLHDITDTGTFRKRLKIVLFDRAYHYWLTTTTAGAPGRVV